MCKQTNYHGTSNTQIDKCIRPLISFLRGEDYRIVACCCGHGSYPVTVVVEEIINGSYIYVELFSQIKIPRTRRFYKRDINGVYYIPEVSPNPF